jgi:hypothetical protein
MQRQAWRGDRGRDVAWRAPPPTAPATLEPSDGPGQRVEKGDKLLQARGDQGGRPGAGIEVRWLGPIT